MSNKWNNGFLVDDLSYVEKLEQTVLQAHEDMKIALNDKKDTSLYIAIVRPLEESVRCIKENRSKRKGE